MSTATPLPTRVNRACDRCRRNKSRCDSYRPCSLCLRASATCSNTEANTASSQQSLVRNTPTRPAVQKASKRRRLDSSGNAEDSNRGHVRTEGLSESQPTYRASSSPGDDERFRDGGTESAISIARKIHTFESRNTYEHVVDAIPGADTRPARNPATGEAESANWASTSLYLVHPLPDKTTMDALMSEYFDSVHWFSLVILEPQLHASWDGILSGFATPSDKPFLLLLSTMFGLAAWYRAQRSENTNSREAWIECSQRLIANSELQLVYIMDQRSLIAIQTLILLGSYYVYHGRPNLSFSLLGATVKAAQSMGLHQKSSQGSFTDREERKRVFWTIYTWDRFASINYGRPLGMSEQGYSVEMPEDVDECPKSLSINGKDSQEGICYSAYQRELNRVYQIASPAIESIYAATEDRHRKAKEYYALVVGVTRRLWRWRRALPSHLQLSLDTDWPVELHAADRAHRLQSLSLSLTFDSLILILHRPFMKQNFDSGVVRSPNETFPPTRTSGSAGWRTLPDLDGPSEQGASTCEELWNAAVRTAKIAELPQLAQHATDGHLVVFVALNLFNASVILVVMALSDPLSDRAQEAKRAVARIYRVLMALGDRSTLSKQTSGVLRSLIQLLISRESDAIFLTNAEEPTGDAGRPPHATVRDAIGQPLRGADGGGGGGGDGDGDGDGDVVGANVAHTFQPNSGYQGVQQGLESVQRAFDPSGLENYDACGANARPQGLNIAQSYTPEALEQNTPFFFEWRDVDDSGMHWIWDPAWDGLFGQMGQG